MRNELEFEDIQAALAAPVDNSPAGLSRRRFLQMSAAGIGIAAIGPTLGRHAVMAGPRLAHDEGVLVVVQMGGGNDGVNTLVPIGQSRYPSLRGNLALGADEVLHLGGGVALHPSLKGLKTRWDKGQVAVVQGIGYADSTLSHFDSMAFWMNGRADAVPGQRANDGWLGRWLDGLGSSRSELEAVVFDSSVPLHFRGRQASAIGLSADGGTDFGVDDDPNDLRMYDAVRQMAGGGSAVSQWGQVLAANGVEALDLAGRVAPAYQGERPGGSSFAREMARAARLINADVGVRVLGTSLGGFDTHTNQAGEQADALARLDEGIEAFFANLDPRFASRVTLMTFSEFGRRPQVNGSGGTDHGTASVAFVIGAKVKGGLVGTYPSLNDLDSRGNLKPQVDFRSVYATVLDRWLRADSGEILGGSFAALPLFRGSPGNTDIVTPAPNPLARQGYMIATSAGGVYNFGRHASYGGTAAGNVVGLRRHPKADGYWICTSDGGVEPFGAADYHGSMAGRALAAPIVDMAVHPEGRGYWLLGGDGGVFSFGDVQFYGSTGNMTLAQPVVGMAAHPSGRGYWFVASDGGVFAFGKVGFFGSTGNIRLAQPVVGMASTPSGNGYWLVASDGGIFAYGDARFFGSTGNIRLAQPVVGMASTPSGKGYWLVASDGGIFAFGDAGFYGSMGAQTLPGQVVSLST